VWEEVIFWEVGAYVIVNGFNNVRGVVDEDVAGVCVWKHLSKYTPATMAMWVRGEK
jgi:hypothetical protein